MRNPKDIVLMHGPAFDGSGEIVERQVTVADVPAYRNAGYADGPIPQEVNLLKRIAELEAELAKKDAKVKEKK